MQIRVLSLAVLLSLSTATIARAEDPAVPPPPQVTDPMLTPLAPPPRALSNWREAVDLIRARSIDLQSAVLDVVRAEGQSRVALAGMLPTITGTGNYTHNFITNTVSEFNTASPSCLTVAGASNPACTISATLPPNDSLNGQIFLNQPLLNLRALNTIDTAKVRKKVAEFTLEEKKRQLALNVAQTIINVVTTERVAELNRSGLRSALERLELTKQKQALGAATGLDVVRAQQDAANARTSLVAGDENTRQAREALGLALGFTEQVGVKKGVNINDLEQTTKQICHPVKLENRSDFQVARANVDVAEHLVKDVKAQFFPTIAVQSTLASTTADVAPSPNTTWNILGLLTVPIWDGGARYGNLKDTNAQVDQAALQLENTRRTALIQLTQADRAVKVNDEKRIVAQETRDLAAQNDDLTRRSYMEGRGTSLDLVIAAQGLRDAEINLAIAEFNLVEARLASVLQLVTCDY